MEGFLTALRSLGAGRLAVIAATVLGTIGFVTYLGIRMAQPPMALLFGGLDTKESAELVGKLDGLRVPYELRGNGTQIMVPEDQVLKLRLSLARDGLPSGGSLGYEIFDKTDSLGTTSFVQNINQLRALEGELARTIRSLDGVSAARVHLVLPRREVFSRETRDPSASVVLKLRSARGLDKMQVSAIQNLVAAAVPELKTSRIAIVDEKGTLLTRSIDADNPGSPASLADAKLDREQKLKSAIESMLERSVGIGKVRAEVSVEMDYSRIVTNRESYDPDQQVARSRQTVTEQNSSAEAGSQGVTVASNLPEARNQGNNGAGGGNSTSQRTEETTNYEIGKILTTETHEAGKIKKISVAVLVDGTYTAGQDGTKTYKARPDDELQSLATLVRSTVGFNGERGDSVEVVNLQFANGDPTELTDAPFEIMGLDKADLIRIAETGIMGIVALLAILLVIRPVLNRFMQPPPPEPEPAVPQLPAGQAPPQLTGPEGEHGALVQSEDGLVNAVSEVERMIDVARIEGQVKASSLKRMGEIVQKHPDEAVAILRTWMYQDS